MVSQRIKYYLLVTANPLSDNVAAMSIFKIINRLDVFSREITVFLPGFHVFSGEEQESEKVVKARLKEYNEYNNREENRDYHGENPIFHTYVKSHGDIYYNDVDFSNFMLELQDRCPNYYYCARTDLVVLPSLNGNIVYNKVTSFNLDVLGGYGSSNLNQIEKFFLSVFNLIRYDKDRSSLELIPKLSELYLNHSSEKVFSDTSDVLIRLDKRILEYMKWKESDEILFISYSSLDRLKAEKLKDFLEKNGKNVWMAPEGIPSGLDYACVIPAALRITSHCLALLSHNSAKSKWVRREVAKAISNDKKLDGILLDGFTMNDIKLYDHLDFMFENIQIKYSMDDLFQNPELLNSL